MTSRRVSDSDLFWWVLSGVAGLGVAVLGRWTALASIFIRFVPLISYVAVPAFLGYLKPDRPWRWAAAFFLANRLSVGPEALQETVVVSFLLLLVAAAITCVVSLMLYIELAN